MTQLPDGVIVRNWFLEPHHDPIFLVCIHHGTLAHGPPPESEEELLEFNEMIVTVPFRHFSSAKAFKTLLESDTVGEYIGEIQWHGSSKYSYGDRGHLWVTECGPGIGDLDCCTRDRHSGEVMMCQVHYDTALCLDLRSPRST